MARRNDNKTRPMRKSNLPVVQHGKAGRIPEITTSRDIEIAEVDYSNHMSTFLDECDLLDDPVYLGLRPFQKRLIYFLSVQNQKNWTNAKTYKIAYKLPKDFPNAKASLHYGASMKRPAIIHCRKKVLQRFQKELDNIPRKVMEEESCIAFSDVAEYFDTNGHLLMHPAKLPPRVRKSIAGIKAIHQKNGTVTYEVTLWNKGGSLARLQSMFGMNSAEKLELSGPNGTPIKTMNTNYDISILSYEDKRRLKELLDKCRIE